VRDFFDTSVLIAAFWNGHPQHESSLKLVAAANKKTSACALHTLAEVFAVMSALPVKQVIPADQAMLFVQEARDRCTLVSLDESEYYSTLTLAAEKGLTGGRIYDALLLKCAAKVKAERIFTWNLKHFRAIAPELVSRIRTP
jgi:predicted nucleic acid-binding protein